MERPQPRMGTEGNVVLKRILAWIVDAVIIGVGVGVIFGVVAVISGRLAGLLSPLFGIAAFAYFIYFEGAYGQTLGKRVLGIVVVEDDGTACDFTDSLLRNLLRVVDVLPGFYILGLVVILLTDENQRIGDVVAGTVVVEAA